MIHEFAVEPELLFEWAENRGDFAYFSAAFGLGHPRILARYPGDWKKRASQHAEASYQRLMTAAHSDEEKGRVQTRMARFLALMDSLIRNNTTIGRGNLMFSEKTSWVDNAIAHAPDPFHAILARSKHVNSDYVVVGDELYDHPRWKLKRSHVIPRDFNSIVAAVKPILQRCRSVTFVDPYFHPGSTKHIDVFRAYLRILSARPRESPPRIEVWCTEQEGKPWLEMTTDFQNLNLEAEMDVGLSVRVVCYRKQRDGEQVHNRYILTDIGGIVFAAGLAPGSKGAHDDITVMELEQYEHRSQQYSESTAAFYLKPGESITIHGTRSPQKR